MCSLFIKLLNLSKFRENSTTGTCITNRGLILGRVKLLASRVKNETSVSLSIPILCKSSPIAKFQGIKFVVCNHLWFYGK